MLGNTCSFRTTQLILLPATLAKNTQIVQVPFPGVKVGDTVFVTPDSILTDFMGSYCPLSITADIVSDDVITYTINNLSATDDFSQSLSLPIKTIIIRATGSE
jgi:hypothetical protein